MFSFSLFFFLGDAQSATERNPSEMEAFSGSFPDYLWEKFSCVDTCGVFVSCAQLQQLGLTKNTVGNVYALLRHYCGRDLQDRPVIPFGSHVHVAKCNESQFNKSNK